MFPPTRTLKVSHEGDSDCENPQQGGVGEEGAEIHTHQKGLTPIMRG